MTTEVRWFSDQHQLRARVYPFGCEDERWRTSIDVYREIRWNDPNKLLPAVVNWPSIGAQDAQIAREFADGLIRATEIAACMNAQSVHKFEALITDNTPEEQRTFSRTILGNNREQVLASIHIDADHAIVGIKEV